MTRALEGAHIKHIMDGAQPLAIASSDGRAVSPDMQSAVSRIGAEMSGFETSAAFANATHSHSGQTLEIQPEPAAPSVEAPSVSTFDM
jgi:hypothetical protein